MQHRSVDYTVQAENTGSLLELSRILLQADIAYHKDC